MSRLWKKSWKKRTALDNRGSAIVTVLVLTVFISVLATTLLYTATRNLQVKQTDYQNKKNFYKAEAVLEEIRTIVTLDASDACAYAYEQTMSEYAAVNAETRRNIYQKAFAQGLYEIWNTRFSAAGEPLTAIKNNIGLSTESAECVKAVANISKDEAKGVFLLQGLMVEVTDGQGYTTVITTDIYVSAPQLNWTVENFVELQAGTAVEQNTLELTDYVVFTNWRKD